MTKTDAIDVQAQWRSTADFVAVDSMLSRDRLARLDELREFFQARIRPRALTEAIYSY